jgi:beta-glucanase (GH16 family)
MIVSLAVTARRTVHCALTVGLLGSVSCAPQTPQPAVKLPGAGWELVFEDNFDGPEADSWKEKWIADAQAHTHILSSRWPENVSVADGNLLLTAKKESRGGQDWTAGSVWTKEKFQYGYFEARYRYARAPGLNNSFWLMNNAVGVDPAKVASGEFTVFEIDVNEGHYPNKISSNIHRWTPEHSANGRSILLGAQPQASFPLEIPVRTTRLRLVGRDVRHTAIGEVRAFAPTKEGYPAMVDDAGTPLAIPANRPNVLKGARASSNSEKDANHSARNAVDDQVSSRWVGADSQAGSQELILEWDEPMDLGCIQVFSGWRTESGEWVDGLTNFALQYWKDGNWVDIVDTRTSGDEQFDLSETFHTYSLLWTPEELVFYFDGKEIRREPNNFCHHPAPVLLSLAVIHWAGPVTDQINGTSQTIDYVRIWQKPANAQTPDADIPPAKATIQKDQREDVGPSEVNVAPKDNGYNKPLTPRAGYRLVEQLSDEFNGTALDPVKWLDHMPFWNGRGARFLPENVSVGGGFLRLQSSVQNEEKLKELYSLIDTALTGGATDIDPATWSPESYGLEWKSKRLTEPKETLDALMSTGMDAIGAAAVISRKPMAKAGYYETRLRSSNIPMSSSFWLVGGDSEFDILESYGAVGVADQSQWFRERTSIIALSTWWTKAPPGTPAFKSLEWRAPRPVSEEFFVLGFLWGETEVKVFYNDKEILTRDLREVPEIDYRVFASGKHVIFDTEILLGPWLGWPTMEQLQDPENNTFYVDWIRVWEPVTAEQPAD